MNAIDLLKEQHQEVALLFEQLEKAEEQDEKETIFLDLADNLTAHTTIEEKIFYPAAYAKKTKELLTEAIEEHLAMKRIIADLLELEPDDERFDAKIKGLKEQFEHHIGEEESTLFKAARQDLGAEELSNLGASMETLFDAEMEGEPTAAIPEQLSEGPPPR